MLVGVCVGVAFDLAGLTAEEAVQLRSDLVALVGAKGVTLRASCLFRTIDLVLMKTSRCGGMAVDAVVVVIGSIP